METKENTVTNLQSLHKIKAICLFSNSYEDALYHHRIAAPLLHSGIDLIHGVDNGKVVPERLLDGDLVVLQRDFPRDISAYEEVLKLAHKNKKPVIFDLDDLIFSLQEGHPDRDAQLYSDALMPMFQALMEVDLVTVSTPKLKKVLSSYNPNIVVLPNYLDDNIWHFREPKKNAQDGGVITIGYMGTESHKQDLEMITPVLEKLIEIYPEKIKLHFWGIEPPAKLKTKALVEWTPVRNHLYKDFVEEFQNLQADIFIAPLVDHLFNRCKSPIKFLEYSALGIPGVYSKLDPYQEVVSHGKNGYLAASQEDWQHYLVMLIEDIELRHSIARNAQQTVQKNWLLSKNQSKWQKEYQSFLNSMSEHENQKNISRELIRSITKQLFEQQTQSKLKLHDAQVKVDEKEQKLILQKERTKKSNKKNSQLSDQIKEQQQFIDGQNKKIEEKDESLKGLKTELTENQRRLSHLESVNQKLLESKNELTRLNQEVNEKEQINFQRLNQLEAQKREILLLNTQNSGINHELTIIRNSRTYKFAQIFHKIAIRIVPPNGWLIRSIRRINNFIFMPLSKLIKHQKLKKDLQLIRKSPYFDLDYYLANNEDVKKAKVDPVNHYMYFGGFEGRDPGPEFSSNGYIELYQDVKQSGINPLVHFLKFGIYEGRSPKKKNKTLIDTIKETEKIIVLENVGDHNPELTGLTETLSLGKAINPYTLHFQAYSDLQKSSEGERSPDYMPLSEGDNLKAEDIVKLIAFYLPQFHPFPENDLWWGRGFTEWTNISKAVPQFIGHHQPRLPGELGYYDLRLYDVQKRQIELARLYGIHGFCFHYYWFNGKRLLDRPLDHFVKHKENNFPFCICWANENWTRRWDGQEDDILIAQEHSYENDKRFIADLKPLLADPRYIKINGRPVIIIYRPSLLKEPHKTASYWREYCQQNGLGMPYLVAAQTFGFSDPRVLGFDAAIEFPPHNITYANIKSSMQMLNDQHKGSIYDYREMVSKNIRPIAEKFRVIRTVCPGWDNEPRKPGKGNSFAYSSPKMYQRWLEQACYSEIISNPKGERFVFINAWNEWGEGAYLEPDRKYGYAYLQATHDAIQNNSEIGYLTEGEHSVLQPKKEHNTAVIVHVYYTELFNEIAEYLGNLDEDYDLFVSLPASKHQFSSLVFKQFPKAQIFITENRGRDIAPFIEIYRSIKALDYKYILKLHTKKSIHREDGDAWRNDILSKLIGSKDAVKAIKNSLKEKTASGIVGPKGHVLDHRVYWGFNKEATIKFARAVGITCNDDPEFNFIAGSMFWAKPDALKFLDLLPVNLLDFEPEPTPPDGALAHAVERFIGLATKVSGYDIMEIDESGLIAPSEANNLYPFAQPYPQ